MLWAALGLVVNILLMRDAQRSLVAAQSGAQAQDSFELWGLVLMAALVIAVPGGIVVMVWLPQDIELSPTLFALMPALYFAAYAGCVWRTHRARFFANTTAWVEAPWIRRLYRFLRVSGPSQPQ